jgi:hypothetical protein
LSDHGADTAGITVAALDPSSTKIEIARRARACGDELPDPSDVLRDPLGAPDDDRELSLGMSVRA